MAAANASSGVLAFPNEVLDDILDHLLALIPPRQMPNHPRKSPQLEVLEPVSLVSKRWRSVALRRLVSKLVVRTGTKARAIVQSLKDGDLGELVKDIRFEGSFSRSSSVPTAADMTNSDSVTPKDVVALLRLTHRLRILQLYRVDFVRFRRRYSATLSTLDSLATVDTLSIKPNSFDANLELMATLVPLFPALRSLSLSLWSIPKRPRFRTPPPPHPFLESLEVALLFAGGAPSIATVFSLISLPTPGQIKSLKYTSTPFRHPSDLDLLLKQVGTGLETLEWRDGDDLAAALLSCPHITTLRLQYIRKYEEIPILQSLPPTVVTLRVGFVLAALDFYDAMTTVPKPSGLIRLELAESHRYRWDVTKVTKLEAYGVEVVFGEWS